MIATNAPSDLSAIAAAVTDAVRRSDKAKRVKSYYLFRCPDPAHEDANPSACWDPGKKVWCCHSRHCEKHVEGGGGTIGLARLLGIDLAAFRAPLTTVPTEGDRAAQAPAGAPVQPSDAATADLAAFALARGLDAAALCETWRVRDERMKGRPALRYPTARGVDRIKSA